MSCTWSQNELFLFFELSLSLGLEVLVSLTSYPQLPIKRPGRCTTPASSHKKYQREIIFKYCVSYQESEVLNNVGVLLHVTQNQFCCVRRAAWNGIHTHTKYFCTTGTAVEPDMTFRTRWPLWDVGGDGQYTPVVGITAQGSKNCWHEGQSESHQR